MLLVGIMAIEVDQRTSGLFRLTLLTNDANYPLLHTATQEAGNGQSVFMTLAKSQFVGRSSAAITVECVMKAISKHAQVPIWLQAVADIATSLSENQITI
jgi:hypothetical protein